MFVTVFPNIYQIKVVYLPIAHCLQIFSKSKKSSNLFKFIKKYNPWLWNSYLEEDFVESKKLNEAIGHDIAWRDNWCNVLKSHIWWYIFHKQHTIQIFFFFFTSFYKILINYVTFIPAGQYWKYLNIVY